MRAKAIGLTSGLKKCRPLPYLLVGVEHPLLPGRRGGLEEDAAVGRTDGRPRRLDEPRHVVRTGQVAPEARVQEEMVGSELWHDLLQQLVDVQLPMHRGAAIARLAPHLRVATVPGPWSRACLVCVRWGRVQPRHIVPADLHRVRYPLEVRYPDIVAGVVVVAGFDPLPSPLGPPAVADLPTQALGGFLSSKSSTHRVRRGRTGVHLDTEHRSERRPTALLRQVDPEHVTRPRAALT